MVKYEPRIIQEYVDRLYYAASSAIAESIIIFSLVFSAAAFGTVALLNTSEFIMPKINPLPFCATAFIIGALTGLLAGRSRAIKLRYKAQMALCQLKIEENTRP